MWKRVALCLLCGTSLWPDTMSLALVSSSASVDRRKSPALWRLLEYEAAANTVEPIISSTMKSERRASSNDTREGNRRVRPEIMAPAGGWPQLRAAVANGADAVYLGLTSFSARARATNFDGPNLMAAVEYAHKYNVKVYVAMNTVIFDDEFIEIARWIRVCEMARVDALIVQDWGLGQFIRRIAPAMVIHSSTQQSITDSAGVAFAHQHFAASRVVLGRELSTEEIASICQDCAVNDDNINKSNNSAEIEVFVHGALCVSYSGQCFSSEAWGGRSANRGQCAQACRLPYDLVVNGQVSTRHDDLKYVLSPQDLCGIDQVPALMRAGVACLKIEGRLKSTEYVAATTRAYRNAVDQEWQRLHPGAELSYPKSIMDQHITTSTTTIQREELVQLFSRGQDDQYDGLTPGFLDGTHHQRLVRGRSPRHRGVHAGTVVEGTSAHRGRIVITGDCALKLGDGICIDRGLAEQQELGGSIFAITELGMNRRIIQLGKSETKVWNDYEASRQVENNPELVPIGAHVWKTHDAAVEKKFQRLSELEPPRKPVSVRLEGSLGRPLKITIADNEGSVSAETPGCLVSAKMSVMDPEKIRKAIGTLGNTDYCINGQVDLSGLEEMTWCPVSWIKDLRRSAVELWEEHIQARKLTKHHLQTPLPELTYQELKAHVDNLIVTGDDDINQKETPTKATLSILCRDYSQVEAICEFLDNTRDDEIKGVINEIVVDFLELDGMRAAVDRIQQSGIKSIVASPRILKPGEGGIWRSLLALEPDGLLIRSTGLFHQMQSMGGSGARVQVGTVENPQTVMIPKLFGDFSLNAANALTASDLLNRGIERITASYDLSARSIAEMAALLGPKAHRLEVVIHCKMPIFHTEHCVFARFLTKGDSYMDCGHACTRNTLHLRDNLSGGDNLVLADMGCRNTVFSSKAQSGIYSLSQWIKSGIRSYRVELVDEQPNDARLICQTYAEAMRNKSSPSHVWDILQNVPDSNGRVHGVTLGSFQNSPERKAGQL